MKTPGFSIPLRPHTVWEGMAVTLSCTVEGCPSPNVTWWGVIMLYITEKMRKVQLTLLGEIVQPVSGASVSVDWENLSDVATNDFWQLSHLSFITPWIYCIFVLLTYLYILCLWHASPHARYKDGVPLTASSQPWNYKLLQKFGLNSLEIRRWS